MGIKVGSKVGLNVGTSVTLVGGVVSNSEGFLDIEGYAGDRTGVLVGRLVRVGFDEAVLSGDCEAKLSGDW